MTADAPPSDQQIQQLIERLRRTGLRLDREGRWWHEDEPVTHQRLARALSCWLDRLDDGRFILRLDADRYAYVDVEDAPFQVATLEREGEELWLTLSDGSREPLDATTLAEGPDGALYCRVKAGRFRARFSRIAQQLVAPMVEESDGAYFLALGQKRWHIESQ